MGRARETTAEIGAQVAAVAAAAAWFGGQESGDGPTRVEHFAWSAETVDRRTGGAVAVQVVLALWPRHLAGDKSSAPLRVSFSASLKWWVLKSQIFLLIMLKLTSTPQSGHPGDARCGLCIILVLFSFRCHTYDALQHGDIQFNHAMELKPS
jgi:hypothetical protein